MSLVSHASRPRVAFSLASFCKVRHSAYSFSSLRTPATSAPVRLAYSSLLRPCRLRASPLIYITQLHGTSQVSVMPSLDPVCFDKVPDRLPDWWDDEEDEEDEEDDEDDEDDKSGDGGDHDKSRGQGDEGENKTGDPSFDDGSFSKGSGGARGGGGGGGGSGRGSGSGDDGMGKGIFATMLAIYTRAVRNAPIRTKSISTCLLALLGDFLAQKIASSQKGFEWDRRRSASIGIWGLCFMGPVLHSWYAILDRLFLGRFSVWQKLLCDQLFFAPFFNGAFIAGTGSMEGMSPQEVFATLKSKLWPSMKANWTLWPAAQFVNFAFVPKTFQIVYVNCVALFWNAILTYISHDEDKKDMVQTG